MTVLFRPEKHVHKLDTCWLSPESGGQQWKENHKKIVTKYTLKRMPQVPSASVANLTTPVIADEEKEMMMQLPSLILWMES